MQHLREEIHSSVEFKCSYEGKTDASDCDDLTQHLFVIQVHGEKEFKCVIESCKKSYSQEAYLKKHMLKHIEASLNDENNHVPQE